MNTRRNRHGARLLLGLSVIILVAMGPAGTTFDLSWSSIDGGGGLSTGETFTLRGVIGQPDAGPAMSGSTFSLSGGLLAVPVAATCPSDFTGAQNGSPDGGIGIYEFLAVLAQWGCTQSCTADISGPNNVPDGEVGIFDFLKVLADWGPCP